LVRLTAIKMEDRMTRRFKSALAIFGVLAGVPSAGQAQGQARAVGPAQSVIVQPAPIPRDVIRIACCKCVDGSQQRVNASTGTAPWKVAPPGSSAYQQVVPAGHVGWTSLAPASWVGPSGAPQAAGDYTYQLQVYVPRCTLPPHVVISGRFAADNGARLVVDGAQVTASIGTANYGFLPGSVTSFTKDISSPGVHNIQFVVHNSDGPTGLVVQAAISSVCPKDLEQGSSFAPASDRSDFRAEETPR
jgi:hypothetical protein